MKLSQKRTCNNCKGLSESDLGCLLGYKNLVVSDGKWHREENLICPWVGGDVEVIPSAPCYKPKTQKDLKYLFENRFNLGVLK